jgi:hypothetical protein
MPWYLSPKGEENRERRQKAADEENRLIHELRNHCENLLDETRKENASRTATERIIIGRLRARYGYGLVMSSDQWRQMLRASRNEKKYNHFWVAFGMKEAVKLNAMQRAAYLRDEVEKRVDDDLLRRIFHDWNNRDWKGY